jgi:hypothetical protein
MAIMVDARNPAQRRYIYQPYWISSKEITALELGSDETKVGCLFSFPAAKYGSSIIHIEKCCFQITEGFAGGTITLELGSYTIATDIVTTGGTITLVDVDEYFEHGTIGTGAATNYFFPQASHWLTAMEAGTWGAAAGITPADTDVPCVGLEVTSNGTMTAGKGRAHFMITEVPLV